MKLFLSALGKFSLGVCLVGGLLFASAGRFDFWQGWLLMGALFAPMLMAGLVMIFKNPELLKKRLQAKEKRKTQDLVVKFSGLMFVVGFLVAGFNFRFGWYTLPSFVSMIAAVLLLVAYGLYVEVMRENAYLSRTIEVQEGQKVVDGGLYAIVRHPMYAVTMLLFCVMPLVLGSIFAFPIFLCYPFLMVKRIQDEEKLLEEELEGYREYKKKVKYRLIPYIW